MDKELLIECFKDTLEMCESEALKLKTEKAKSSTRVYGEHFTHYPYEDYQCSILFDAEIIVVNDTTFMQPRNVQERAR